MAELCLCCCQAGETGNSCGDLVGTLACCSRGQGCNSCGDLVGALACYQCVHGCNTCDCHYGNDQQDYSSVNQEEPKVVRMSRDVKLAF